MPSQEKIEAVAELKGRLEKRSDFILASYSGLTVEEITNLRAKLRKEGSEMKVIKNNLFLLALKESEKHKDKNIAFGSEYKGPLAAIFADANLPSAAKILKEFAKTNKNLILKAGYLDGSVLNGEDVEAIAGLPSREQLLAQIAGGINGPARSIASGLNQIIAGLARAIQAAAEKNNQ
ncbi:50S ribosomal protein L10 [Leptospira haakeii]|uniref:Large ribosomal subunit protein uL10 n=1 Tax=Leptospira haakeii TaxID=2023198 RepID=A0ABX4PJP9_9LEPT|nr:50S ribosomal protein L10 [Leptospira haakeii]PKA14269.1 50S ribosomal protein L10 [Leptospira haakeii]PKA19094.1 50S ribosomal protein L10 [Leptospira haakeii]